MVMKPKNTPSVNVTNYFPMDIVRVLELEHCPKNLYILVANVSKLEEESVGVEDYIDGVHYSFIEVKIIDIYLEVDSFGFEKNLECLVDLKPLSTFPNWVEVEDEFDRVPINELRTCNNWIPELKV